MTAKVIRIPEFRDREADTAGAPVEAEAPAAGWDPYEVWRTRVLQPRLSEARPEQAQQARRGKRSFFDRFRRSRTD